MARTKRTTRTPRKASAAAGLQRLKAAALSTVGTVIKQGNALQARGRKLAVAKARAARAALSTGAAEARVRTAEAATRFERAFEHRVSQAMSKIGVPTARDVRALSRQVAQLQHNVEKLRRSRARA